MAPPFLPASDCAARPEPKVSFWAPAAEVRSNLFKTAITAFTKPIT